MRKFFGWFDRLAAIATENRFARWLERIAFFFLILTVLAAPLSIAATQAAWLIGMAAQLVRLGVKPRPRLVRTPLDVALWAFFLWSAVTCVFSYAPDISLDKMRGAAVFLIFYFVTNNLRTRRAVRFLAGALVFSATLVAVWTPLERLVGRGVEIRGVAPNSPLTKALLLDGDALLKANNVKIKTPEDLLAQLETNAKNKVEVYRGDYYFTVDVARADLLSGENGGALGRLGVASWRKSHAWRSTGFFGHWTTFSEVLQLTGALVFGLLLVSFPRFGNKKEKAETPEIERFAGQNPQSAIAKPRTQKLKTLFSAFCSSRSRQSFAPCF